MNIAIVDDQHEYLEYTKNILYSLESSLNITCFDNPFDFLESVNEFQAVFLDIAMTDMDGITISKLISKNDIVIIFMTSHKELMINAFGKNVIGFILKENLKEGIYKYYKEITSENLSQKIIIQSANGKLEFDVDDIVYIHYCLRNIEYHFVNLSTYEQKNINLKDIVPYLTNSFIMINRSTYVNTKYITKFQNGYVYFGKKKLEVSRRRKKEIEIKLIERKLGNCIKL